MDVDRRTMLKSASALALPTIPSFAKVVDVPGSTVRTRPLDDEVRSFLADAPRGVKFDDPIFSVLPLVMADEWTAGRRPCGAICSARIDFGESVHVDDDKLDARWEFLKEDSARNDYPFPESKETWKVDAKSTSLADFRKSLVARAILKIVREGWKAFLGSTSAISPHVAAGSPGRLFVNTLDANRFLTEAAVSFEWSWRKGLSGDLYHREMEEFARARKTALWTAGIPDAVVYDEGFYDESSTYQRHIPVGTAIHVAPSAVANVGRIVLLDGPRITACRCPIKGHDGYRCGLSLGIVIDRPDAIRTIAV